MKGKLILSVADAEKDRKVWEALRMKGIGGSDAAVIMGLNPWKSAYTLWCEKTGLVEPEDLSNNEYVYWGTVLEQAVANRFRDETGKGLRKCGTLQDENYDFILANVDRLVIGEDAGLECKTANGFKAKEWDGDQLPDAYYCQVQHYLMVTGCTKWYIACLIGGNHYVQKEILRNEAFIDELRAAEIAFWDKVKNKIPPELDGSDSTSETLGKLHPESNGNAIPLPSGAAALISRLDELALTEKILKLQKEEAQNALKALLGDNEVGTYNDRKVSWKLTAARTTIDSKALKAEMPDVYAKYSKVGAPTRRFMLK